MSLLLLLNTPALPPTPAYIHAALVIGDIWPPLNAMGAADAVFWTEAEMYEWFNQAMKRLSGLSAVFVERNTSITAVTGTPTYNLPDAHQATIQADFDGALLRARTTEELEALDDLWVDTTGEPESFILDQEGAKKIRLYPTPTSPYNAKTLALLMRKLPAEVSSGADFLTAPQVLANYPYFYILAEARSKESKVPMPEITAWLREILGLYEQTIQTYLGGRLNGE